MLRMSFAVLPGFEPKVPFMSFKTSDIEVSILCLTKWYNWNDRAKANWVNIIMSNWVIAVAMTQTGCWIKATDFDSTNKTIVVFFVQTIADC